MRLSSLSFCAFLLFCSAATFSQSPGAQPLVKGPALTAREVVERIKANVGIPWRAETVDTFKAGDPNTRVTGVAVTMMATFDVLQRAVAVGDNLVITHEPTFYNHLDHMEEIPKRKMTLSWR